MPNPIAYLALLGWPIFALACYARFRPQVATLIVLFGGTMLLPEKTNLDLPFHDPGKLEISAISCFLGIILVGRARRALWASRPLRLADGWVILYMAGAWATVKTNPEPLRYGETVLFGLEPWEAVSMIIEDMQNIWMPFVLGRAMFTTREDLKLLLRAFQLSCFLYVPFIVTELIASPQMHNWIYGFAQHDFIQTMRGNGYRPMVFMAHGLALTLMLSAAILCGMTLSLARKPTFSRIPARYMSGFLLFILLICKSLGAAVFAFLFTGVMTFLKPRGQLRVLVMFCVLIVAYPVSRATEVFPAKELVQFITTNFGPERSQSLEFRFDNEMPLAEHASKKPMFGWGRYQRNMLFSIWTGQPTSVSDGYWVILYGVRGAWGFITFFAIMLTPVFLLRRTMPKLVHKEDRILLTGATCVLVMYAIDMIPNGFYNSLCIFLAGALMSFLKYIPREAPPPGAPPPDVAQQPAFAMPTVASQGLILEGKLVNPDAGKRAR